MAFNPFLLVLLLCGVASAADVLAHFMVANAYNYSQNEWQTDIAAAQQIGIDGFALNWAPPDCPLHEFDWYVSRIDDAFAAATAGDFKLIYSFDMSYTPSACSIGWNTTFMASMIAKYATSPAAYLWNGDVLVSTYAGEGYGDSFFAELKSLLAEQDISISLSPALTTYTDAAQNTTVDPTAVADGMLANYTSIDGYLNWQAWPYDTDTNLTALVDVDFEAALRNASRTGPYIMCVSPWQFKDLNDGTYNSWVEYSDVLFPNRWDQAINTVKPDIVEIITWNDFEESHYIRDLPPMAGPAAVDFGVAGSYIYGQDHSAWRVMAQYYISWYKTGVTDDRVVFWYRIHPKQVPCDGGTNNIGVVRNAAYPADAVFAWALVSDESTISMNVGSNQNWTFQADASGPVLNMVPFPDGIDNAYPTVTISRNGNILQTGNGSVAITQACSYEDYNPVVALAGPAL